ncbi:MAG: tRNA pseudouridine synthase A [Deltaproteobacteria bacterium]|nr:tRNA pseudouridine synthase A [Deltaproteobacteria bacterium]
MSRISLLIRFGYDGSRFHGLQPQNDVVTAGGTLRDRLEDAAGIRPRALFFSARTDAGVHALENAATCWFKGPLDVDAFIQEVARDRDDGLHRVRVERVPIHVHARGCSRGKRYRYIIDDGCVDGYFHATHSWRVLPRLDVDAMREAALILQGEHDFSSFRGARCSAKTPVKHLVSIRISDAMPVYESARLQLPERTGGRFDRVLGPMLDEAKHERRIFVDIAGDAFLRKMIRIVVGTLAEVGIGWRQPQDMHEVLDAKVRQAAGLTAPARGLSLLQLGFSYPDDGSRLVRELHFLEEERVKKGGH